MNKTTVESAIARWRDGELVSDELAEKLRAEHARNQRRDRRRFLQYALSATAGILLVIAAVAFFAWSWPEMGPGARSFVIAGAGIAILLLGMRLEARGRHLPVTYALQTSGLAMLLAAYAYSAEAWGNATAGGVAAGSLALATPAAVLPVFVRRNPVMPAVGTALGYGFLAVFLFRVFDLDPDSVVWILDGALLATLAALGVLLRVGRAGAVSRRALHAFAVSLYAGYPMVAMTAAGPLELGDDVVLALDAWLLLVTALALWGIHRAPPTLRSARYRWHVAASVLLAIPLGFATALETYDLPPMGAAAVVAGAGACGLWYGLRSGARALVPCSCATVVSAAWYLAVDASGRLGTVLALAFTAALFFWVATRSGRRSET